MRPGAGGILLVLDYWAYVLMETKKKFYRIRVLGCNVVAKRPTFSWSTTQLLNLDAKKNRVYFAPAYPTC